jgi:hypothetical protein
VESEPNPFYSTLALASFLTLSLPSHSLRAQEFDYYESVGAEIEVGWGGDWGCPLHKNKSCDNVEKNYGSCDMLICWTETHYGLECTDAERATALQNSKDCINNARNGGAAIASVEFNVNANPLTEEGVTSEIWIDMYGDCNECDALYKIPANAGTNRIIGAIFLFGGLCWFGCFLLRNGGFGTICGWGEDSKSAGYIEEDIFVETAGPLQIGQKQVYPHQQQSFPKGLEGGVGGVEVVVGGAEVAALDKFDQFEGGL